MRITKISLQSFRAFEESFELDLDGGKNLLLYGENGSGKSSIYLALKRFFEERGEDVQKHRNHFSPGTRESCVRVYIEGKDSEGEDHDAEIDWDVAGGHPLLVPEDPASAPVSSRLRSLLIDGARRAGFLDYRVMLRTHLLSMPLSRSRQGAENHAIIYGTELQGLEEQLFDLMSLVILRGVRVTIAGGSESTIGTLMRSVWESRPPNRRGAMLKRANERANLFNDAFNARLGDLETSLARFLDYFDNHQLSIKFQPVSLAWDKDSLELKGAELIPEIEFRGAFVTNHHQFLNEARLSALATCLFLAGVLLSDNDVANPAHPRFLVLDDALIGLDLQNRLPVLRILTGDCFKNYQILLLTHDRVWFDLARGHLREKEGWLHRELLADESTGSLLPRLKSSESDLERASTHLGNGDLMAAAVYARAAFEWKLRNVCEKRGIEIKYKKKNSEMCADSLWQGIVARQRKREKSRLTHAATQDFIPPQLEKDVEAMRSTVLNQLSHAGAPGLVRTDVQNSLDTVKALHDHDFPKP